MFRSRRRIRAFLPSFSPSICFVSYAAPHLRCWPFIVLSLTLKTNHSILAITRGKESNQSVCFLFCFLFWCAARFIQSRAVPAAPAPRTWSPPPPSPPPPQWARGPRSRVRPHCHFRNRRTEYISESGMKWISGGTKRQCDRALPWSRRPGATRTARCRPGVRA